MRWRAGVGWYAQFGPHPLAALGEAVVIPLLAQPRHDEQASAALVLGVWRIPEYRWRCFPVPYLDNQAVVQDDEPEPDQGQVVRVAPSWCRVGDARGPDGVGDQLRG